MKFFSKERSSVEKGEVERPMTGVSFDFSVRINPEHMQKLIEELRTYLLPILKKYFRVRYTDALLIESVWDNEGIWVRTPENVANGNLRQAILEFLFTKPELKETKAVVDVFTGTKRELLRKPHHIHCSFPPTVDINSGMNRLRQYFVFRFSEMAVRNDEISFYPGPYNNGGFIKCPGRIPVEELKIAMFNFFTEALNYPLPENGVVSQEFTEKGLDGKDYNYSLMITGFMIPTEKPFPLDKSKYSRVAPEK